MSACNNCGKFILFGGRTIDGQRYCGPGCANSHALFQAAARIPADVLQQHVEHWRNSACPSCKQQGRPIDVYSGHRVHSFLVMTQWSTKRKVSCRRCGRREQLVSALYSATLGWWGLPWGLLVTPVQIVRNVAAAVKGEPARPSAEFERIVRMQIADRHSQAGQAAESFSAQR